MDVHGEEYEVEVRVTRTFHGSHSLPMRPELHGHKWEVEFSVSGPVHPETGMVCDMLHLHRFFQPFVDQLDGQVLHDVEQLKHVGSLGGLTAKFPTCDTLAHYFLWKILPVFKSESAFSGLRLSQIKVSIAEPDGVEPWGHAIIRPKPKHIVTSEA